MLSNKHNIQTSDENKVQIRDSQLFFKIPDRLKNTSAHYMGQMKKKCHDVMFYGQEGCKMRHLENAHYITDPVVDNTGRHFLTFDRADRIDR